jgi:O-acetylserine/cysteine efflux transporter
MEPAHLPARPNTLLAFGIQSWLLRLYPAVLIAPFALLVPIVGMSCAAWLFGQSGAVVEARQCRAGA